MEPCWCDIELGWWAAELCWWATVPCWWATVCWWWATEPCWWAIEACWCVIEPCCCAMEPATVRMLPRLPLLDATLEELGKIIDVRGCDVTVDTGVLVDDFIADIDFWTAVPAVAVETRITFCTGALCTDARTGDLVGTFLTGEDGVVTGAGVAVVTVTGWDGLLGTDTGAVDTTRLLLLTTRLSTELLLRWRLPCTSSSSPLKPPGNTNSKSHC